MKKYSGLSPLEQVNLATFSENGSLAVYRKTGLTGLESEIVSKYFTAGGLTLDIGCGTGRTTAPLAGMGYQVIGMDLSGAMVREARAIHQGLHFMVMNACSLGFASNTFSNVLFSFNGLDCIAPRAKRIICLREIHRVLKPGGVLAFSSHNAFCVPRNRIGWGIVRENFFSGRLFSNYRREREPQGDLYLYYGVPFIEVRALRSLGFAVLGVQGKTNTGLAGTLFTEPSPYYIVRKQ